MQQIKDFSCNLVPYMMVMDLNVFRPCMKYWVSCQYNTTLVITLEDGGIM